MQGKRSIWPARKVLPILGVLLLLIGTMQIASAFVSDENPRILLLHSYTNNYRWTADEERGFLDAIHAYDPNIVVDVEYMDTKRFTSAAYYEQLLSFLQYKYTDHLPDAVAVTDDNALRFVLAYREELFPDVPLYFAGINSISGYELDKHENIYGLVEEISLEQTVHLIDQWSPEISKLTFIFDRSVSADLSVLEVDERMALYDQYDVSFMRVDTIREAVEQVKQITSPDNAIIYGYIVRGQDGTVYDPLKAAIKVSEVAEVPVWGLWDFSLPSGLIGGKMVSGYAQGEGMADLLLKGMKTGFQEKRYVDQSEKNNRFIFDYRALVQHGLQYKAVPGGSLVLNKPETFVERNWEILLVSTSIVVALLIYSMLLRMQVRRKTHEIERTTKQLMEYRRQASLINLVTGIAHEINTPIGTVLTANSFAKTNVLELEHAIEEQASAHPKITSILDNLKQSNEMMMESVQHVIQLIDGFKKVAVLHGDEKPIEQPILEAIGEIVNIVLATDGTSVEVELEGDLRLRHPISRQKLYDIFEPLTLNALQHGFSNHLSGVITIRMEEQFDNLLIQFHDNGEGMSPTVVRQVFEPFYSTAKYNKNVGLGLFRAYNAISASCGEIECRSDIGSGTTFTIRLPKNCSIINQKYS